MPKSALSFLPWVLLGGMLLASFGIWLVVLYDPWVLVQEAEWLGPTRYVYTYRPLILILGAVVTLLGIAWIVLRQPRVSIWEWILFGVAVLGSAGGVTFILSQTPPVFLG